jgi:hypothetical protein
LAPCPNGRTSRLSISIDAEADMICAPAQFTGETLTEFPGAEFSQCL